MSETKETEGMTAVWVCGYCTRPFRDVPHNERQQATTPPHDLPWWGRACRGAGHPARLAVVTQAEDGSVRLEPTRWAGEPGKAPWQGAIDAEHSKPVQADMPEDEIKAIGEAVAAKVASMHENADPAVRAALENHERDKDDLCRKLEAAIINGTAARNGLRLAALREKNLRAENERLKAELEREREKPAEVVKALGAQERVLNIRVSEGALQTALQDARRACVVPWNWDIADVMAVLRRLSDTGPTANKAEHVPCCSVCGGLGGTLKDADAPVPAHLPPCPSPSKPYFGPACAGSGRPATWGAPEQPWAKATLIPSDKPAEPVPGVDAKERTYAKVCAAESQLQAMARCGPVVVDPVGSLYDPNRCTARGPNTGGRCGARLDVPHDQHYAPGTNEMWAVARPAKIEAEKRIEALENQHLDHRLTALHEAHQALRDDVRHLREDVGALWNSVMPTKLVERLTALERQGLDARLAWLRREFDDHVQQCLARDADLHQREEGLGVWLTALTDRVKALEGGAKEIADIVDCAQERPEHMPLDQWNRECQLRRSMAGQLRRLAQQFDGRTVVEVQTAVSADHEARIKALEGGAKASPPARLYRVQDEREPWRHAGLDEGGPLYATTRSRAEAENRCFELQHNGPRKCWLEVSDDNGRTWKRCTE